MKTRQTKPNRGPDATIAARERKRRTEPRFVLCRLRSLCSFPACLLLLLLPAATASAATRYVWQSSPSPTQPYTSWATAAQVVQDAVDAAAPGDEIVVTNGIYATGGRAVGTNLLVNRVAVDKPLTLRSVNGPQVTIIQGAQAPDGVWDDAVRCVYLTSGASLSGFTLTNGSTREWDDQHRQDSGGGVWCESATAVISNCVLTGNSAWYGGGGAYGGTLNNCTLSGNSAGSVGGGACAGTLNNCTLTGNSVGGEWFFDGGGGAAYSTLNNCTLTGNSASDGGGALGGTLNNCTITRNSAGWSGGGAADSTLNNCTLTGNSAYAFGGGALGGTLHNCTITGNSANGQNGRGGGADGSTLNNCIVYFNTAPNGANYSQGPWGDTLNYCCTTPLPTNGLGNITLDPQLASASHLSAGSPCRGAGNAAYTTGTDIDGEGWASPPSIGCNEYHAGAVTGPLSVAIVAAFTNVTVDFPVGLTALIEGRSSASVWEFGDGVVVNNQPYASHAWTAPGNYPVVLRAYNESAPAGASATVTVQVVAQPVHYVAAGSANPLPPYASWATAATNIQDAVDAAVVGGTVLVTNGTYATGGRAVGADLLVNRVAVDKPLTLRSVNGPQVTIVQGAQALGDVEDGAVRCVYLTSGASLSGFTLTNGATPDAWDQQHRQGDGGGVWCESPTAVVSNCVLAGNSARFGGGVYGGTLNNCTITGNSAGHSGGGAYDGRLNNCTITRNSADWSGGGAAGGTLNNCTLTGNSANGEWGGGGGAAGGTLNNCTLTGNSANGLIGRGGGVAGGTLNNCTLTGNSANGPNGRGGGAADSTLNNCIIYFNIAPNGANYESGSLNYTCTTPLPTGGTGNISLDPQLASASHLSAGSLCRGAGSVAYATGRDIDGEAWANPPSIGCDEYYAGAVAGPLSVAIAAFTNVATGFPVDLRALIEGRTAASVWEFGDGVVVSNQPYASYAWRAPGNYAVVLRAYNESAPAGVSATVTVQVVAQPVHYVAAGSGNPLPPYVSWATAARSIQEAVDAASVGALVLVTNGVYATGGRAVDGTMTNRLAVDKPLRVRSVNGAQVTVIRGHQVPGSINGDGAIRCVYLANGASLSGFSLTNGATRAEWDAHQHRQDGGGGVWCESATAVISNCVLVGNSAFEGGGAYWGTLNNCTLTGNSAAWNGGGASGGTLNNCALIGNSADYYGGGTTRGMLNNCTLTGNWADSGGGAFDGTLNNCTLAGNSANGLYGSGGGARGGALNNCIVYFNTAPNGANHDFPSLNYCCTTPLPTYGVGNITNAPLFVNQAGGDLRLQPNSPCINAGNNSYLTDSNFTKSFDLDGLRRIVSGTVDIGAYEFQGPGSTISYAWLQRYGLPTDGSADSLDADDDGHNNWQEWRCLTDPSNELSALRLLSAASDSTNVTVTWQSVAGVSYFLERSADRSATPPFTLVAPNLPGQPDTTSFTDTNAASLAPLFYRVGVGP